MVRKLSYNGMVVVGVDCFLCGDFVAGTGHRMFCYDCVQKWQQHTPRWVIERLNELTSFGPIPEDLKAWNEIKKLRDQGIYRILDLVK